MTSKGTLIPKSQAFEFFSNKLFQRVLSNWIIGVFAYVEIFHDESNFVNYFIGAVVVVVVVVVVVFFFCEKFDPSPTIPSCVRRIKNIGVVFTLLCTEGYKQL